MADTTSSQPAPNSSASSNLTALRTAYERDGYVILPASTFPEPYLCELRSLASASTDQTRSHAWPHTRLVGKRFPPFDASDYERDYWGVQHLMHPDLAGSAAYRDFYSHATLLQVAAALLDCPVDDLQMELFNLLVNPTKHAFALGWHRDDIRPDVGVDEETERLAQPAFGIQWNVALYDDDCLFIVPGTHARVRTEEEVGANQAQPPNPRVVDANAAAAAAGIDGTWSVDPPNTLRVSLKAGETCIYSQRLLHRASYLPTKRRATLHGCYGQIAPPTHAQGQRARMILQHDVEWMKSREFAEQLNAVQRRMWANLISEYEEVQRDEVGYSLDG